MQKCQTAQQPTKVVDEKSACKILTIESCENVPDKLGKHNEPSVEPGGHVKNENWGCKLVILSFAKWLCNVGRDVSSVVKEGDDGADLDEVCDVTPAI